MCWPSVTSEINFKTKPGRRRGWAKSAKARAAACWCSDGGGGCRQRQLPGPGGRFGSHAQQGPGQDAARRALKDRIAPLDRTGARPRKAGAAARVTVVHDREGDIYASWAACRRQLRLRAPAAAPWPRPVERDGQARLRFDAHHRAARHAQARGAPGGLSLRFARPRWAPDGPERAACPRRCRCGRRVVELNPPAASNRCAALSPHAAADVAAAWQIVDWYRLRWTIEQLFRLMKTHGLQLEDSQRQRRGLDQAPAIAAKRADLAARARARKARARRHRLHAPRSRCSRLPPQYQAKPLQKPAPAAQPPGHLDHRPLAAGTAIHPRSRRPITLPS